MELFSRNGEKEKFLINAFEYVIYIYIYIFLDSLFDACWFLFINLFNILNYIINIFVFLFIIIIYINIFLFN